MRTRVVGVVVTVGVENEGRDDNEVDNPADTVVVAMGVVRKEGAADTAVVVLVAEGVKNENEEVDGALTVVEAVVVVVTFGGAPVNKNIDEV